MKGALLGILLTLASLTAIADQPRPLTAEEAAHQAQQLYGGRVLDIQSTGKGRYRVKLLSNGRVRVVEIGNNRRGN